MKFYTFDEIITEISPDAKPYAEKVVSAYICGVNDGDDQYPMAIYTEGSDARFFTESLALSIAEHFAVLENEDHIVQEHEKVDAEILNGFRFTPNKGIASIYVGKRNRLYFRGDVEATLGVRKGQRLLVAFNPEDKAFAVIKPNSIYVNNEMKAAGYFMSGRKDLAATSLFREFKLKKYEGMSFYLAENNNEDVFIFRP